MQLGGNTFVGKYADISKIKFTPLHLYYAYDEQKLYGFKNNGDHFLLAPFDREEDPIFEDSPAYSITQEQITNWDIAFSWGDHAEEGYLTEYQDIIFNPEVSGEIGLTYSDIFVDLDNRYSHTPKGDEGQVYYIDENDTNNVTPDYIMKHGVIVESQKEFDEITNREFSLEEIFNTWTLFSHYYGVAEQEQSPPSFPAININSSNTDITQSDYDNNNVWSYDSVNDKITLNKNYNAYTGFISPETYSNYELSVDLSANDSDNDWLGVIIAFYKNPLTGYEYTLSVLRTMNGSPSYVVYFNFAQNPINDVNYNPLYESNTQTIVYDGNDLAPSDTVNEWDDTTTSLLINRENNVFTIKTSQFGSNIIDDDTLITINLDDYPEYSMFNNSSNIGFSGRSQNSGSFSNINFSGFNDYIFWVKNNGASYETYFFNQSENTYELQLPKIVTIKDYLGPGRFIYSYFFDKTYYVTQEDFIIKISDGFGLENIYEKKKDKHHYHWIWNTGDLQNFQLLNNVDELLYVRVNGQPILTDYNEFEIINDELIIINELDNNDLIEIEFFTFINT